MSGSFEDYLLSERLVSQSDIDAISKFRRETGASIYSAIRKASSVQSQALVRAIADYHNVPRVEETEWTRYPPVQANLSTAFLRENKVYPLGEIDDGVLVAMEDPSDGQAINALRIALDKDIFPRVAAVEDILAAIERSVRERGNTTIWQDHTKAEGGSDDVEHLRDMALGAPVVRYVNQMIQHAVHARATDIHIEPFDGRVAIRIRVDGMLRDIPPPPAQMSKAVVSRVKILSGLNIAERRLPQDGRARIRINEHRLDLRIATIPTIHGESVAIRLLDNVRRMLDFAPLGFNARDEAEIRKHLSAPYGLMLVTGPTGSGKTTTLATALSLLNKSHRKILTIEDPIEYELDGVNQTQAKPSIGLTFADALRSFLRHDPDVLMVGEMRDGETASISIHAALTGHLVLSTLHTNTAAGAIPRLLDMGIDAFLLASSLRCVIGQRLVRVLCDYCKRPSKEVLSLGGVEGGAENSHLDAVGCERCFGTGYSGRLVIAEVLSVDDEVRQLIRPDAQMAQIEAIARRKGMTTMIMDGVSKCRSGRTTQEEVRRVALDV